MEITTVAEQLGIKDASDKNPSVAYSRMRQYYFERFRKRVGGAFQSPSIFPTTIEQRSLSQNYEEHSVYQRSDFIPLQTESSLNRYFFQLRDREPVTLLFSSGMAAISTTAFFLRNVCGVPTTTLGENSYFETKWVFQNYPNTALINEYQSIIPENFDLLWLEYPINCTYPTDYPFSNQLNIKAIADQSIAVCHRHPNEFKKLVFDYTLHPIPFDLSPYLNEIPDNLDIFLITSLQKHRGYGLDLTNGGAITYYSTEPKVIKDQLRRLQAIWGTSITQESLWLMPEINPKLINQLIEDSGNNAQSIAKKLPTEEGPIHIFYADNPQFKTSFIYLTIDDNLIKKRISEPYLIDLLIRDIIEASKSQRAIMVHGTSFGLPNTRIFKNSERYDNCNSLRLAIGYDEVMNEGVDKAIQHGISSFVQQLQTRLG